MYFEPLTVFSLLFLVSFVASWLMSRVTHTRGWRDNVNLTLRTAGTVWGGVALTVGAAAMLDWAFPLDLFTQRFGPVIESLAASVVAALLTYQAGAYALPPRKQHEGWSDCN